MPTYSPSTEQAQYLLNQIRNIMSQIHSAESGNRLERDHFRALLIRKNCVLTEANRIIKEVNDTLNFACSDRSNYLPFSQYQDLKNARTIAREVIKSAHSNPIQNLPTPPNAPSTSPNNDAWALVIDDDLRLPF